MNESVRPVVLLFTFQSAYKSQRDVLPLVISTWAIEGDAYIDEETTRFLEEKCSRDDWNSLVFSKLTLISTVKTLFVIDCLHKHGHILINCREIPSMENRQLTVFFREKCRTPRTLVIGADRSRIFICTVVSKGNRKSCGKGLFF